MKALLTILLLCSLQAGAADYYISTATATPAASASNAGTMAAPWTLDKLNASWASIAAGDNIYFKRGEVFYGSIVPAGTKAGTALNRITIAAYGSGPKPVISGFTTVTAWNSLGGNIYESAASVSNLATLNVVTVNGKNMERGRYPNASASNGGWLESDAVEGKIKLTDAGLPQSPNWTGATIVNRLARWSADTGKITAHTYASGKSTLTFPTTATSLKTGYGYIITNHASTLDQHGEWYYTAEKKLRIYLSSAPSNYVIKAAGRTELVTLSADSYFTFQDIVFEGANEEAVTGVSFTQYITFAGCEFNYTGSTAVYAGQNAQQAYWRFEGCSFQDVGNWGIDYRTAVTLYVNSCTFKRIGILTAQGGASSQHRNAIMLSGGNGHEIGYSKIDSTGYGGMRWNGTNVWIHHNEISNYNMRFDDGGGIYSGNTSSKAGSVIEYNFVHHGIGAPEGTTATNRFAIGIYSDDGSNGSIYRYNVCYNNPEGGLYLHNNNNVQVYGNVLYNNGTAQATLVNDDDDGDYAVAHNIVFKNNYCIAATSSQFCAKFWTWLDSASIKDWDETAANAGQNFVNGIDSNYYMRPTDEEKERVYVIWRLYQKDANGVNLEQRRYYSLAQWNQYYLHDSKTGGSPVKFPAGSLITSVAQFYANPTATDSTISLPRSYKSHKAANVPAGSYTLPAYSAVLLLNYDIPIVLPVVQGSGVLIDRVSGRVLVSGGKLVIKK